IPSKISLSQKRFSQIEVRFFAKAHDPMNRIAVRPLTQTNRFAVLNVTEPGTRPCWFDTDGDKLACLLGHIGSQSECFLKRCSVCDDMIGRQNGHNRRVIASCYPAGAERDGEIGRASCRERVSSRVAGGSVE